MDKEQAVDILLQAISDAYPVWSSSGYKQDFDKAVEALDFILEECYRK